jgi:hypothetical protein
MRRVECELGIGEDGSPNVNAEGRNSCSQKCEGDENLRLCSPMFAYVRLCSLNGKKNVEGATRGHRGLGENRPGFKFLTVRDLISHCTGSGYENAKVRIRVLCGSQSNRAAVFALRIADWREHRERRSSLVSIGDFGPVH